MIRFLRHFRTKLRPSKQEDKEYDTKQSHSMISLVGKSNENLEDPFTNFATNFTNYTLPDSLCSDIPTR
ncbi:hypothetical protein HZH68_013314 [Vespula germanica]|uniref:Uncharacterized protein n=1 Tax=Vespula germanica TaxID=30212 RepID=A0A834JE46_VESGE|nr:hypothetical protein HZH68_013314 [Vespula germanica]